MAKSLRSKSKRKFRAIRRSDIHGPVELARTVRLAAKSMADVAVSEPSMEIEQSNTAVEKQIEEEVSEERGRTRSKKMEIEGQVVDAKSGDDDNLDMMDEDNVDGSKKRDMSVWLSRSNFKKFQRREKAKSKRGGRNTKPSGRKVAW